jgi:hypothetical protein
MRSVSRVRKGDAMFRALLVVATMVVAIGTVSDVRAETIPCGGSKTIECDGNAQDSVSFGSSEPSQAQVTAKCNQLKSNLVEDVKNDCAAEKAECDNLHCANSPACSEAKVAPEEYVEWSCYKVETQTPNGVRWSVVGHASAGQVCSISCPLIVQPPPPQGGAQFAGAGQDCIITDAQESEVDFLNYILN